MRTTTNNAIIVFCGNIISALMAFVVATLFARKLGPSDYGKVASIIVLMNMLIQLSDCGTNKSVVRMGTAAADYGLSKDEVISVIMLIRFVLVGLMSISCFLFGDYFAFIFYDELALGPYVKLVTVGIIFGSLFQIMTSILQEQERFYIMSINKVVVSTTKLIMCLCVVYFVNINVKLAVIVNIIPYMVGGILGYLVTYNNLRIVKITTNAVKKVLSYSGQVSIVQLSGILMMNIPALLLAKLPDKSQMGYFSAAQNIALGINMMSESLIVVLLPKIIKNSDQLRLNEVSKKITSKLLVISSPLLILIFFSRNLIEAIYGQAYAPSYQILSLLIIAAILDLVTIAYSACMYKIRQTHYMVIESVIRTFLLLLNCSLLVKSHGALGISVAIVINAILCVVFRLIIIKRATNISIQQFQQSNQ